MADVDTIEAAIAAEAAGADLAYLPRLHRPNSASQPERIPQFGLHRETPPTGSQSPGGLLTQVGTTP